MPVDYTHLDALLLKAIQRRQCTFGDLRNLLEAEFDKASPKDRHGDTTGWRVMDRRLQALRKKNQIRFEQAGWVPVAQGAL